MDSEEEPFVVDRVDSFPHDRAYPSRSTRSEIRQRPTDDSLYNDRHPQRRGSGDFEPRRRLRYIIPLRRKSNSVGDEESGYSEKKPYSRGDSAPLGIDRDTSRDPAASPPEFLEIISTKWVPDDEGREIVTLTVKDQEGNHDQGEIQCESRWKHIHSDAMTLGQFYREVMRTPGLGDDDLALVGRLLNKVRNTSEKKFVHGRYLKSITLVYEGEDPDLPASYRSEDKHVRKTATFISLPVFTTCYPKRHTSTKEFEGHPVRALLQSRYRLESTKRRDKEQVITKTTSIRDQLAHESHVVHVPQIWALMINDYTIITCSALKASVLRGDTINLISYTAAQRDEATWSVHFTDARGKDFYLPLRFCKTWFDLVKQITDHCLYDEFSFIRDQLLKGGPVYQLVVASDESLVDADKWSKLVEETKTEVIHLRLIDKESVSYRSLVTYYDKEGNEVYIDSDSSADTSTISSSDDDRGDSDSSESSISSGTSSNSTSRAVDRLRTLQAKLREAEDKGDAKKVVDLKRHRIPALEKRLLELAAVGLDLDTSSEEDIRRGAKITILGPYDRRSRSGHGIDHDCPLSPTERYRARLSSRLRSTSRSRLVKGDTAFSGSTQNLSREERLSRGRATQPRVTHDRNHSGSRSRYFRDVEYDTRPRTQPRKRSHMSNPISPSRTSTLPAYPRSHWDLLRSRVRDRQVPGLRSSPISPTTGSPVIYYRPSEKQLVRSYWDLVRSSVLSREIHKIRDAEGAKTNEEVASQAKASTATALDKQKRGANSLNSLSGVLDSSSNDSSTVSPTTMDPPASFVPPKALDIPAKGILGVKQAGNDPAKPKKVLFSKDSLQSKPKLKRLIKLAHGEPSLFPKIDTSPAAPEILSPISAHPTTDIPIFLWSTQHQPSESGNLALRTSQLSTIAEMPSSVQKPAEGLRKTIHTSKTNELILHAVLAEVRTALKKPKRGTPEYAALYEKTPEKSYADVVSSVNAIRNARPNATDGATADERNINRLVSNSRRASLASASMTRRRTDSIRSVASMPAQNDAGVIKLEIFDLARTILLAFVPKGYEAPVIAKYWGAFHSLLTKASSLVFVIQPSTYPFQDDTVLNYVRERLSEICSLIHSIQMGVRAEDGSKQQRYQIPRALPAAFQHLVLLLVVIGSISDWSEYSWSQMRAAFDDCETLLIEGRKQLLLMVHTDDYRDSSGFQAVDSEALLSLILANLISSMSTNDDFHLTEVYAEYTTKIQGVVRDSASVKVGRLQRLLCQIHILIVNRSMTTSNSSAKNWTLLKVL